MSEKVTRPKPTFDGWKTYALSLEGYNRTLDAERKAEKKLRQQAVRDFEALKRSKGWGKKDKEIHAMAHLLRDLRRYIPADNKMLEIEVNKYIDKYTNEGEA